MAKNPQRLPLHPLYEEPSGSFHILDPAEKKGGGRSQASAESLPQSPGAGPLGLVLDGENPPMPLVGGSFTGE